MLLMAQFLLDKHYQSGANLDQGMSINKKNISSTSLHQKHIHYYIYAIKNSLGMQVEDLSPFSDARNHSVSHL
jgi:hypothetical protein